MEAKQIQIMKGEICPYCEGTPEKVDSILIYKTKSFGMIWICKKCNAYAGVKGANQKARGRLSKSGLRETRKNSFFWFNLLVERNMKKRRNIKSDAIKQIYKWLAGKMKIAEQHTNLLYFDEIQCMQVVGHILPFYKKEELKIILSDGNNYLSGSILKSIRKDIEALGWDYLIEVLQTGEGVFFQSNEGSFFAIPRLVSNSGMVHCGIVKAILTDEIKEEKTSQTSLL